MGTSGAVGDGISLREPAAADIGPASQRPCTHINTGSVDGGRCEAGGCPGCSEPLQFVNVTVGMRCSLCNSCPTPGGLAYSCEPCAALICQICDPVPDLPDGFSFRNSENVGNIDATSQLQAQHGVHERVQTLEDKLNEATSFPAVATSYLSASVVVELFAYAC